MRCAFRRVAPSIRTTFCCSDVGSEKSDNIEFYSSKTYRVLFVREKLVSLLVRHGAKRSTLGGIVEKVLPKNSTPTVLNSPPLAPVNTLPETIATDPKKPVGGIVNNSLTNLAIVERGSIVRIIRPTS